MVDLQLLKFPNLGNKAVIGGAMQAQGSLSTQIVEASGEYFWMVKDNQTDTRKATKQLFVAEKPVAGPGCPAMDFTRARSVEKGCGDLDGRSITVSRLMNNYADSPYFVQVRRFFEAHPHQALRIICRLLENPDTDLSTTGVLKEALL